MKRLIYCCHKKCGLWRNETKCVSYPNRRERNNMTSYSLTASDRMRQMPKTGDEKMENETKTEKEESQHIELNKGSMWIHTPHGTISIHVGFGGIHQITSWLPHELKIQKKTLRGQMQVTQLEATFESRSAFIKEALE